MAWQRRGNARHSFSGGTLRSLPAWCTAFAVVLLISLTSGFQLAYATDLEDCGSNLACRTEGADNSTLVIYVKDSTQSLENNAMFSLYYKQGESDAFPWSAYRGTIDCVRIAEGVWNISHDAFRDMTELVAVDIPKSLNAFATDAFYGCDKLARVVYNGSEAEWADLCNRANAGIVGNPTVYCMDQGDVTFDIATGNKDLIENPTSATWVGAQAIVNFVETAANKDKSITPMPAYGEFDTTFDIDKDGLADIGMGYQFEGEELKSFMIGKIGKTPLKGSYTITLSDEAQKYQEEYSMARYKSVTFIFTKSLKDATISGIKDATYTGSAIAQLPVVMLGGVTLVEGTDYMVKYADNVNVGTATMTFTGIGNYGDEVTKTFNIKAAIDESEADLAAQMGEDGTALGKGASVQAADKALTSWKKETDPKGSVFSDLQLRMAKVTKTSVKIAWNKVKGAKSYVVYGSACGKSNAYVKLKVLAASKASAVFSKVAGKKVKKGTYYKFVVVALSDKSGAGDVVSTSKAVHAATKGGKAGNDKAVKAAAKKGKLNLKIGKSFNLKAKAVPQNKRLKVAKHRVLKYESTNPSVADVSSKGKITAKKNGTAYVYAYAQDGVSAKVKVSVS